MRKVLHFRRTVFCGLFLLIGVLLCWLLFYRPAFFGWACALVAPIFVLVWLFALRDRSGLRVLVIFTVLLAMLGAGFFRFFLAERRFDSLPQDVSGEVEGRVELLMREGAVLAGVRVNGQALHHKVVIGTKAKLVEGEILRFTGSLTKLKLRDGNMRVSNYLRSARYLAYPEAFSCSPGRPNVFEATRNYLRSRLSEALKGESYEVGIALLIGDSNEMGAGNYENFRKLGILHIFAVSGLHFSILFGFLFWAFGKLRLGVFKVPLTLLVLVFYAGVCNFSPSVLRAFFMICVYMGAKLFKRRYDMLSSLFFALTCMLLMNPFYAFSIAFSLSFFGVLSIALLNPVFLKLFRFLPKRLRGVVSLCFAVQIGIVPAVSFYFGSFYTVAVFVNMLISPLVAAAYLLLVLMSVAVLPFRALYFLFSAPRALLEVLLWMSKFSERLVTAVPLHVGVEAILLGICLTASLSFYVNLRKAAKALSCALLCVVFALTQGLAFGMTHGDFVVFSERGALLRTEDKLVFIDAGSSLLGFSDSLVRRDVRRVDLWIALRPETFLTRLERVTDEGIRIAEVALFDAYSGEESGMLVYAKRHFGARGTLLEAGEKKTLGGAEFCFAEAGALCFSAGGLRFAAFLRAEQEPAVRRFAPADCYFALNCGDYPVRTFCANCDGRHADALSGELLFRFKSGIMSPSNY